MEGPADYNIFLHIIKAKGFGDKSNEVLLTTTLNGVKFDIEGYSGKNSIAFNCNCIWEYSSEEFKRIRIENRPIKVECIHKNYHNIRNTRKVIGFFLMPIRSLQFVKTLRNFQVKLHWYKLNGLSAEWRQLKPEVYLSALIATKEIMRSVNFAEHVQQRIFESTRGFILPRNSDPVMMLNSTTGLFIKVLEDECLLQVGNSPMDCHVFVITLVLKRVRNLYHMLGSAAHCDPDFHLYYNFMGGSSNLILKLTKNNSYNINEKFSLNLKSSLESLFHYFQEVFYIPMELYYNGNIIGDFKFTWCHLLPPSLDAFNDQGVWKVRDSFYISTLFDSCHPETRPCIEYTFSMTHVLSRTSNDQSKGYGESSLGCIEESPSYRIQNYSVSGSRNTNQMTGKSDNNSLVLAEHNHLRSESTDYLLPNSHEKTLHAVDELAYEIVLELEEWKAHQIGEFLLELRKKEKAHMQMLTAEWERQRTAMISKLQVRLDECSRLVSTLESAECLFHEGNRFSEKRRTLLNKIKDEFLELSSDRFERIEDNTTHLRYCIENEILSQEAQLEISRIDREMQCEENAKLRSKIMELEQEIEHLKANSLSREQLSSLVEDLRRQTERYHESEQAKTFYKDQWGKLAKEMNKLKLQSLRQQEEKLKRANALNIDDIINFQNLNFEENAAIQEDNSQLDAVKKPLHLE